MENLGQGRVEMTENTNEIFMPKLAKASYQYTILQPHSKDYGPWAPRDVDRLEFDHKNWKNIVEDCRYYYKRDPFSSVVLNKMVDLSINGLMVRKGTARESAKAIMESIEPDVLQFLRSAALEYLLSGLVIPEIEFDKFDKSELDNLGIKRFSGLMLPRDMWIRDPTSIIIKDPMIGGRKSYFVEVPDELRTFIQNKGKYQDGEEDPQLYQQLLEIMPEFVAKVQAGETKILLDNPLIIQYRTVSGDVYPTPFMYPSLESLKHKRNLRRMDYSIASRVITAIMLIRLGDKDFPLTEDNEDQLEDLKQEMRWRESNVDKHMERIFQLFGNHTLQIDWVFPDVSALLDDVKYKTVNQDIAVGLGFPRILVTGETERSFASDPEIATISPLNTMERIREAIFPIVDTIVDTIEKENDLGGEIDVQFMPINLMAVSQFVEGIKELYMTGNLSREDFDATFGFDLYEQIEKRIKEKQAFKEADIDEFAPVPHSNQPGTLPNQQQNKPNQQKKKPDQQPKKRPAGGKNA